MTAYREDLEDRLRRVLHEQAGSLQVRPGAWPNSAVSDPQRTARRFGRAGDRGPGKNRVRSGGAVRRLPFGGLAVVFGAAVTVLVAVVAVLVVGRHSPTGRSGGDVPVGARSLGSLVSELAILRRPQTLADRHAPASVTSGREVVHNLTRLAATVSAPGAEAVRVYLVVRMLGANGSASGARHGSVSAVVTATIVSATGRVGVVGNGWAGSLTRPVGVSQANGLDASIVPDGVARVKWVFAQAVTASQVHRLITVYPTVRNNVALAPVARQQGLLARVTWYDANGHVVQTFNAAAERARRTREIERAISASSRRRVAPALITSLTVLRAPRRAGSPRLPSGTAAAMAEQGSYGLNITQARFVTADGHGFWLVPGTSGVCLSGPSPSGLTGCNTVKAVEDGGLVGGTAGPGWGMLEGVAPDGNPTISIVLSNGQTKHVPVIDNVYAVTVHVKPTALIVRNAAGRLRRLTL
jgi:hypothetical protein